jgi:hypothetical protein
MPMECTCDAESDGCSPCSSGGGNGGRPGGGVVVTVAVFVVAAAGAIDADITRR